MARREELSYYCCICGSPFTPDRLRKATTASSGEDECDFALFKVFCDCGYGGPHDESCAVLKDYNGDLLPSGRIAWLMHARMICAKAGSFALVHANQEPSLCFVTDVGVLAPRAGFVCSKDFGPIRPMEEGFIVHEACWNIFGLVYKNKFPSRGPINLSRLWLSMCIRSPPSRGTVVDWGSSYGGAAKFHGKHWDARQGSEAQKIFTFGIIVAVYGTPDINPYRLDIYSRWVVDWPPTYHLEPRHGCGIRFDKPYIEPRIFQTQNTYVSLVKCGLTSVRAYYPYGDGNPVGGLRFTFVDGSDQLVGRTDHDAGVQANVELILDAENGEEISGWSGYFGYHTDDGCPHNLYALNFETSLGRSIDLGNTDAFDIEYGFSFGIVSPYRILGFQIGGSPPWIESFSRVTGQENKALGEP